MKQINLQCSDNQITF